MISVRQALPLQSSVGVIQLLPANYGPFMLDEGHLDPDRLAIASLSTLVRQRRSGVFDCANGHRRET